jgi:choline-glycine betaine transporter
MGIRAHMGTEAHLNRTRCRLTTTPTADLECQKHRTKLQYPPLERASEFIETNHVIGQDNIQRKFGPFGLDIHNPVLVISGLAIVAFVFFTLVSPTQASTVFSPMFQFTTKTFDWFFIASANFVVIFALVLVVTPLGKVRLGGAKAMPDYSYLGWFAMLFAAGMGIGQMFCGVSEPMTYLSTSLAGTTAENGARTDGWMSIFGGTAIHQLVTDNYTAAQDAAVELQFFKMLAPLPLVSITSFVGLVLVLVIVFFVTSSDSGSLVIDTITAGGTVDAPLAQRVFWCIFEGAVAIALLVGGGLAALQSMVISTGVLFTAVLLVMCFAIYKGLANERRYT